MKTCENCKHWVTLTNYLCEAHKICFCADSKYEGKKTKSTTSCEYWEEDE